MTKKLIVLIYLCICISLLEAQNQHSDHQQRESKFYQLGAWANYGNNPGGNRYSPLSQINKKNVKDLKPAWSFRTGELDTYEGTNAASKAAFETTPLMIDSIMYFSTPSNRVFAIHAGNGQKMWSYDPEVNLHQGYSEIACRGVSKWIDDSKEPNEFGYMHILVATIDGRIIALESRTGEPVEQFGIAGIVDLKEGVGRIQFTSPPAVLDKLIIIGCTMGDNHQIGYPRGVVRALNARNGKTVWTWDPIPRKKEDPGFETWQGPNAHSGGAANAWAPLSVDIERGIVFVPTSCPSTDYYGGERKGSNLFANSLVALEASSGKLLWHFQTVHHDIWDYDNPAQPILAEIKRNGEAIPAVIVVTKMGHIFAFHRETGKAIYAIEERPVPPSTVSGEEAFVTQPFPSELPLLGMRKVDIEDAWGPGPEELERARSRISSLTNKGIFTPPSLQGTMVTPGNVGGMNWSGAAFHPEKQILIANINNLAAVITLHDRESQSIQAVREELPRAELGRQIGTPYMMTRDYLLDQTGSGELFLQTKPPWGTLVAVNMEKAELAWEAPLGFMMDPRKYPEAPKWGSISLGGAITTAGELVFIGGSMDGFFRAYDINNGNLLWQYQLPAGGQATPMSYMFNSKQYVVIAAGGHGKLGTTLGDYVMAFSLD